MNPLSIVALILGLAVLARFLFVYLSRFRAPGKSSFGEADYEAIDADVLSDIAYYHQQKAETRPDPEGIDAITWADLDMDSVYAYLNRTQCVVGEEVLYSMLHEVGAPDQALRKRRELIDAYADDEDAREAVARVLKKLGKDHFHGLSAYLFHPQFKDPGRFPLYAFLAILPLAALALCAVHFAFLYLFLASYLINLIIHYASSSTWRKEIKAISFLYNVIHRADQLTKESLPALEPELQKLRELLRTLKPLRRWGAVFLMERVSDIDFITDYLKIQFQLNMIGLCKVVRHMTDHTETFNRLYALVGELDAMLAVASARAADPRLHHPDFSEAPTLEIVNLTYPLIQGAVPNSLHWARNLLITGSNASGKSTFTKAVAVSAILAQTIHTVCADSMRMPRAQVFTSMAIKDNILTGDSYFIAEIKSLKRLLTHLRPDRVTLCFIDEILRGTNTVERIAASHALLRYLAKQNALLMAATHDVELTTLLEDLYENRHFREQVTPEGMRFPYTLMEGPAATRNAIALLRQMDFPAPVVEDAERLAAHFDEERSWG